MKTKIITILSVIIFGLVGYLLYKSFSSDMSEMEIKTQFSNLKLEYKQMQEDLEYIIKDSDFKGVEILAQKKEIDKLVGKNMLTEEELHKAKAIMENLTKVVLEDYKSRLKTSENQRNTLIQEKEKLAQEVEDNQVKISQLNEKYSKEKNLSERKDKVIEKKNEQIYLASRLVLSNFNITGFRVRGSGREVQTDRASRIDRIKVDFEIIPNALIESGKKSIYTIIYKPSGEIVSFENKPAGTFIYQNKKMQYSDELSFDYTTGAEKTLTFVWDSEDFERGDYVIEVYEKTSAGVVLIGKTIKSLR